MLPCLAEGPKTLEQLDVPAYATARLEAEGLVRSRGYRFGHIGIRVYFLPEDLALLDEQPAPLLTLPRKHCWELRELDWPPEDTICG